jgi:DNA-directed RNA polymerase subunit RPC12/RpoP
MPFDVYIVYSVTGFFRLTDSNLMPKYPAFKLITQNETLYFCCVCKDYLDASKFQQANLRANIKYCRRCNVRRVVKYRKTRDNAFRVFVNSHHWDRTFHGTSRESLLTTPIVKILCDHVFSWQSVLSGRRTKQMILIRIDNTLPLSAWNCMLIHTRETKLVNNLSPEQLRELTQPFEKKVFELPQFREQKLMFDVPKLYK